MQRILVFSPFEDRAGRAAALAGELAQRTGARVHLLRVLEERLGTGLPADASPSQQKIRQLLVEVETQQVEELAETVRASGADVSVEVCWGVPWEAVLERVERDGYDLVVKPANGIRRRGHVFFGATALHLFRRSPCPVWVVGDDGRLPERVLAAVDPVGAAQREAIAAGILGWAEQIGSWADAELHVGTAWNAAGAELLRHNLDEDEWKAYVEEAYRTTSDALTQLRDQHAPALANEALHLVEGVAHEALPELARARGIDLIIMGTRGNDGAVGDHLGETAETMIREVHCSVLTIPPGVSPEAVLASDG